MTGLHVVVTTIQGPTSCMRTLSAALPADATFHIVGDAKGPTSYALDGVNLLTLDDQRASGFTLARDLPTGHYARKNIGYLEAIRGGAELLYETDDDNEPLASWAVRDREFAGRAAQPATWFNAYRLFSDDLIWPRGYPLRKILEPGAPYDLVRAADMGPRSSPIQQGLADGSPDVDAVWRLVLDRDFRFSQEPSVLLGPGTWCPFNSQSTWWWPEAFPLLYLPSHCSFRMTDIWRSFVAQRCLWERGQGVAFHAPEVVQLRNEHDLLRDFSDEVPGYEGNEEICDLLAGLPLDPGADAIAENLRTCYRSLVSAGFVGEDELALVDAWINDLSSLASS